MKHFFFCIVVFSLMFQSCKEKEIEVAPTVLIYPNPFINVVQVDIESPENWEISILTSDKQKIETISGSGSNRMNLDLSAYKNQIVICQILIGSKLYVYQLINAGK